MLLISTPGSQKHQQRFCEFESSLELGLHNEFQYAFLFLGKLKLGGGGAQRHTLNRTSTKIKKQLSAMACCFLPSLPSHLVEAGCLGLSHAPTSLFAGWFIKFTCFAHLHVTKFLRLRGQTCTVYR